ncbi:Protein of uncharacterised function (DUF3625) [Anaerobiospirillum thomasii]|uniref:DotH/IcmK family type IV secretion protein n=1 Tax=Anaerobiospirillum thomasii TaxID=179995 RepID=UPI000D955C90|nr:DotH/IcmK family type IV secretion protein [Anaerobiospirillum thomasii]SPT71572.1 Protein of uncharacterised function (DUF3625) [Anaerobiospirillum thomasii]
MKIKSLIFINLMQAMLIAPALADIVSPQAPPELGDTLTDFRTKEQLEERHIIEFGADNAVDLKVEDPLLTKSDELVGLLRISSPYLAGQSITVPQYGSALMRFYDMYGNPWDIARIELENQGYIAKVTAAPSELLVNRLQGAANTKMTVHLSGLMQPLIFNLNSLSLLKNDKTLKVVLNSIKVNYVSDRVRPYTVDKVEFSKTNPFAPKVDYSSVDFKSVRDNLVQALSELK